MRVGRIGRAESSRTRQSAREQKMVSGVGARSIFEGLDPEDEHDPRSDHPHRLDRARRHRRQGPRRWTTRTSDIEVLSLTFALDSIWCFLRRSGSAIICGGGISPNAGLKLSPRTGSYALSRFGCGGVSLATARPLRGHSTLRTYVCDVIIRMWRRVPRLESLVRWATWLRVSPGGLRAP